MAGMSCAQRLPRRRSRASGTAAPHRGPARPSIGEARVAVAVLGPQRLDLHELGRVDALGDLAAEERVEAARDDDRVEGRVRDEAVDAAADQELDALAVLHRRARRGA